MDPAPDPAPDPAIFAFDLETPPNKLLFSLKFSAYYVLKVHLHNFSKNHKEVTKQ
jgi:hypothetical protein